MCTLCAPTRPCGTHLTAIRLAAASLPGFVDVVLRVQGLAIPDVRVLWSVPADQQSSVPATLPPSFKVRVSESTPNFKVLASSAVNVVVSHCGLGAAQEALYFGKPLLCIPFFGDQVRWWLPRRQLVRHVPPHPRRHLPSLLLCSRTLPLVW